MLSQAQDPSIQGLLPFLWLPNSEMWVRQRTCQGCEMCYVGKFLDCLNDHICGTWIRTVIVVNENKTRERKIHPRMKDSEFEYDSFYIWDLFERKYPRYRLQLLESLISESEIQLLTKINFLPYF